MNINFKSDNMKKILTLLNVFFIAFITVGQTFDFETLENNNISATFNTSGSQFWDLDSGIAQFEAPIGSGITSIHASSLWIGGRDVSNQLHLAGTRYNQIGYDFSVGPISNAQQTTAFEERYNRIYKVSCSQINTFISFQACIASTDCDEGIYFPNYSVPEDILEWPAHGDTTEGEDFYLAPFVDVNNDGVYNPLSDGDYPKIKGTEMLFFILNDNRIHTETGAEKLEVEIHVSAYTYDDGTNTEVLDNTLFVNYKIFNRSNFTYTNTYLGTWTDFDIGGPMDDYVGSFPNLSAYYGYNGDDYDEGSSGALGYEDKLAAQGVVILGGPFKDADGEDNAPELPQDFNGINYGDLIVDNERLGASSIMHFNNSGGLTGDPQTGEEYYNYLTGKWKDGSSLLHGGNGHSSSCISPFSCNPARYMFPGEHDTANLSTGFPEISWSEESVPNVQGDRRAIASAGPFTFYPGASHDFDIAYVFAQNDSAGQSATLAVAKLKQAIESLPSLENMENNNPQCQDLVWPGDANNDGLANVFDIFPLGYAYSESGPTRADATSNWIGQEANDWTGTFANGLNHKYADCDGNGDIDALDVLPIALNYGLSHSKGEQLNEATEADPELYFETNIDTTFTGTTLQIPIHLGTSGTPANDVYGIAFTLNFDPSLIDTNVANISFTDSWLGVEGNDLLTLQQKFISEGQIHVGMVRNNLVNQSNHGLIATLEIATSDDLIGKMEDVVAELVLSFSDVKMVSANEMENPVNLVDKTIFIVDAPASSQLLKEQELVWIYPVPASDVIYIKSNQHIQSFTIKDITGKNIQMEKNISNSILDVSSLPSGIYLLELQLENELSIMKRFVKK